MPSESQPTGLERLLAIVERLHAPAPDGCPWCLDQTHASLADDLIKETYEVTDAARRGDHAALREEIGDALVLLIAQTYVGEQRFSIDDIAAEAADKLIRRHPHIFGDVTASTTEDVVRNWESIKRDERQGAGSILDGVPRALPALLRADEVQQRAAAVGFDWPDLTGVIDKVHEELAELQSATPGAEQIDEMGDVFFSLVNLARRSGISAESAVQQASDKFVRRFRYVEDACRALGRHPEDMSLDELDAFWNQAKALEQQ